MGLARCRKERQYCCLFFPKTLKVFNADSESASCFCSHSLLSPSSTRKSVLLRAFSSYVQVQVIIGRRNHRKESKTKTQMETKIPPFWSAPFPFCWFLSHTFCLQFSRRYLFEQCSRNPPRWLIRREVVVHYYRMPGLSQAATESLLRKAKKGVSEKIESIETEFCYNLQITSEFTPEQKIVPHTPYA